MNNLIHINNNSWSSFPASKVMHVMRAIAIFCVICAHCTPILNNSIIWDYSVYQILSAFGILGVPIFFFSSGYFFFNNQRKSYPAFLKNKVKTFFIPWVFTTTLVFLYVALRKGGLNVKDYLYFIIGIQNYTYFLTVLMIFFLCMLNISYSKLFIVLCIALSVISLTLTSTSILNGINPYCNPFNWLLYFITGIIFNKYNWLGQFAAFASKYIIISFVAFIALAAAFIVFRIKVNYWSPGGYFFIVIMFMLFLGFATKFHAILSGLVSIGKESLVIYLIHSPFAGILVYLATRYRLWYIFPINPLIVLISVLIAIHFYKKISVALEIENFSYPLLGISKK